MSLYQKKTKRILDLGTGNGRLIKLLKEKIPTVKSVAIDFSPPMLKEFTREFVDHETINKKMLPYDEIEMADLQAGPNSCAISS